MFPRSSRICRAPVLGVAILAVSLLSWYGDIRDFLNSTYTDKKLPSDQGGPVARYFGDREANQSLINKTVEEAVNDNRIENQSSVFELDELPQTDRQPEEKGPEMPVEENILIPENAQRFAQSQNILSQNAQSQGMQIMDRNSLEEYQRLERKAKQLNRPDILVAFNTANCVKVLPHCIIAGVMKAGTEAFTTFLTLNPQIAMHLKTETVLFFNSNYNKGLEWYRQQMPCSRPDQVTIEKSPQYFSSRIVPTRIRAMNSSMKLLIVVRDPVARAISHFSHVKDKKPEMYPATFEETVMSPDGSVNGENFIIQASTYATNLKRWLAVFPLQQIHIVDGDKMVTDPQKELEKVETFLGINHFITPSMFTYDVEKGFYCLNVGTDASIGCLGKGKGRKHPDVEPLVLQKLKDFFRDKNTEFYSLIGQSFTWNGN